jgi:hypothetical protein
MPRTPRPPPGHLGRRWPGRGAHLVDEGGQVAVGVAHDPQRDLAGVLGQVVGELVQVPCRQARSSSLHLLAGWVVGRPRTPR